MALETLSETLARHLVSLRGDRIPGEVRQAAILHILDTVGVILAGSRLAAGRHAYELAKSLGGSPEVTLPGTGERVALLHGVMASSVAAHCGEMDDIHAGAGTCVGGMIVPALLAMAEKHGAKGSSFIEAVVAGYETTVRVGLAINGPQLFARGWWPSSVCGVFGVAAAGAKLLDWPVDEFVAALGTAGLLTGGLLTGGAEGATARHLTFGRSAQSGVLAILATAAGFTAPRRIFEDPRGFCSTLCEEPRWEFLQPQPDSYFLPQTAFKPFPCARQLHAGVDGLLGLMRTHGIAPASVDKIELGVPTAVAKMVDRPDVHGNRAAALASAQYVLAVAALQGKLDLASFEQASIADGAVKQLMNRVCVIADAELDAYFPKSWPGKVRIRSDSQEVFENQVLIPKGEMENPMSVDEVEEKFHSLVAPIVGTRQAADLCETISGLEGAQSLDVLVSALGPQAAIR